MTTQQQQIWDDLVAIKCYKPPGISRVKVQQAARLLDRDPLFWMDIIVRHNLTNQTVAELRENDPDTFGHLVCNFWGQIAEVLVRNGIRL